MHTFESLLEELSKADVKYILIDGLAVDLCGFSRSTVDVDIIIDPSEDNIVKLLDVLKYFGKGASHALTPKDFPVEEGCIRINEDFPLDVFTLMQEMTYNDFLGYTENFTTKNNISIPYLNADGLILLKKGSARPKDQIDVQELEKLKAK